MECYLNVVHDLIEILYLRRLKARLSKAKSSRPTSIAFRPSKELVVNINLAVAALPILCASVFKSFLKTTKHFSSNSNFSQF